MTARQAPELAMDAATFANEDELSRVPPALEDGCARFLAWCAPLVNDEHAVGPDDVIGAAA
jgi:hypothetical protein